MRYEQGNILDSEFVGGGESLDYGGGGGGDSFAIDYADLPDYSDTSEFDITTVPDTISPDYMQSGDQSGGEVPYATYTPEQLTEPTYEPLPSTGNDLIDAYIDHYIGLGYDPETAVRLANEDAATSIQIPTSEPGYADYVPLPLTPTLLSPFPTYLYLPLPM